MSTNTLNHISDESKYKTFNPAGTSFPSNIVNVQDALAALNPIAVNGIPGSTETVPGIIRIATQQEVNAGDSANTVVTPKTLKERLGNPQASTTKIGLTRYATTAEAVQGTIDNAAVVPTGLKGAIDNAFTVRTAKENVLGVIQLATIPMAEAGMDDTSAMTPLKTQRAIAKATAVIPVYGPATESALGVVRIATNGQVAQGTLRDGYAVSPSGLASLTANESRAGIARAATAAEVNANTSGAIFVTPNTLNQRVGTTSTKGLVQLTTVAGQGDGNTALAFNADVLNLRGGQTVNGTTGFGNINVNGNINAGSGYIAGQQIATVNMLVDSVPVGTIIMWPGQYPPNGNWMHCDGTWLGRNDSRFTTLFSILGTLYGGDANNFALPDMRGMFPRGVGKSNIMNQYSGNDSKGKPGLGYGCGDAYLGQSAPQAVRRHKHNIGWGEHHNRGDAYFGCTVRNGYLGNNKRDSDNYLYFTNEGDEVEDASIRDGFGTMNTEGLIQWENRPWSIALNFVIKVR
ncbi:hypothetical protein PS49_177 [Aeromonas phage PS49]